ncbi:Zn-ribbon domain-containing OB-fold protein, partial [Streptomyces rimosus]
INRDNAGFWAGVADRKLLIQRCTHCATLRFPWLPGCNHCGGDGWDTVEATGHGTVFSYVVMHHPPFPAFDPPYAVGLIELTEGVRMVAGVVGVPPHKVRIGMPVRLEFRTVEEDLVLPVFHGARQKTPPTGTRQRTPSTEARQETPPTEARQETSSTGGSRESR